jgi:two-component system chemotaxis sensor kinase CheA
LAEALKLPQSESSLSQLSAVVLQARGRKLALGVDRIGGAKSYVVHDIPKHARAHAVIEGAVLNEHGAPSILLAPWALLDHGTGQIASRTQAISPVTKRPILVVDDSLTTRMLEQSILEGAGYEVDLATSGQEGLEKARSKEYAAFIVDVEMPLMNGFEFLGHVKNDPNLRDTPAILVTSLDSDEHKRRGKEAGAYAYMVKSDFDQELLLTILKRFV